VLCGSSLLIHVALILLLLASVLLRRDFPDRLGFVVCRHWMAWVVGVLIVYGIAGAVLIPRLFLGQTVPVPSPEGVKDLPLAPTSPNIAQTGFLVLAALTHYAFATLLFGKGQFEVVCRGFLSCAVVHASLGTSDLADKLAVFALGVVGACHKGKLAAPVRRVPTFTPARAMSVVWAPPGEDARCTLDTVLD
jgi:hypothetical protein